MNSLRFSPPFNRGWWWYIQMSGHGDDGSDLKPGFIRRPARLGAGACRVIFLRSKVTPWKPKLKPCCPARSVDSAVTPDAHWQRLLSLPGRSQSLSARPEVAPWPKTWHTGWASALTYPTCTTRRRGWHIFMNRSVSVAPTAVQYPEN